MRDRSRKNQVTASLLGAAVALLTGCGSTVQQTSAAQGDPGLGGSTGASSPGTSGTESLGSTGATGSSTGTDAVSGTSTSGGSAGGSTGSTSGELTGGTTGTSGASGSSGTGATSGSTGTPTTRPLKIGVTAFDYSALAATFGVAAPTGDQFAAWKNLIAYINKHGGLAGRQVQADYYKMDGAAADQASTVAAGCTHFTQDHKVDVVMTVGVNDVQGFAECLLKHGIPQFDSGQYVEDATQTARTPNQFTNAALAHDRMAATLMKVAITRGWLTKKDVLGVVHQVCAVDTRVYQKSIVPAMKAAGIRVVEATTNCINGNADIGAAAGQLQNAVLKFRSEGVTQVTMPGAPEGAAILLFSQSASQQKYYPGYLLTSNSFAYDNSNSSGGTWPQDELKGMKGISFSPILDVGLKAPTTPKQAKAQAACRVMDPTVADAKASSQPTAAYSFFYGICDSFRLLDIMLKTTRGAVSVGGFADAYAQAANSIASAKLYDGTFATQSGRRDGAATVVPFSYKQNGCKCMSFDGAPVSSQ